MEQDSSNKHTLIPKTQNLPVKPIQNITASNLSLSQKARALREWAESHRRDLPLLSDEAISRESIYSNERL